MHDKKRQIEKEGKEEGEMPRVANGEREKEMVSHRWRLTINKTWQKGGQRNRQTDPKKDFFTFLINPLLAKGRSLL